MPFPQAFYQLNIQGYINLNIGLFNNGTWLIPERYTDLIIKKYIKQSPIYTIHSKDKLHFWHLLKGIMRLENITIISLFSA